tara:strand:- start:4038 stop:4706 length:669 start_codon:yes stop_codon:yes gene_type:complete
MANAHENIDKEILANTLQEILKTSRGESMDVLYKALTKGGDERYIHRNIHGLPTDERTAWQGNILRGQIEQDPTFADTLSYKEGKERLAPRESISSKLLKALGIYEGGGEVVPGISYKGKVSYGNPWKQTVDPNDNLGTILNALQRKRSDENYKYMLPEDYLEGYSQEELDSLIQVNDLMQYIDPKQPKKEKGVIALLQRLLPGRETGRSRDFSKEKSRFNR